MVDMLNGTPLVYIKPFFSKFDNRTNTKSRWVDNQGKFPFKHFVPMNVLI